MLTKVEQDLQRATPESQGIASAAVLQFIEALDRQVDELHSVMLLRHGRVVAEGWWSPYRREYPHALFSLSKSFTSTAAGFAIAEGLVSLDDPVLPFFADDAPAEVSPFLAEMRVRHLLSMSTGQIEDTMPPMMQRADNNWIKGFFSVPVLRQPGTHFLYNTGATHILSAIVEKVTGMKLIDYLTPRLFDPLGIEGAFWEVSPQGITVGGFGMSAKTEDIARFGQLYLQNGVWQGRRILPEGWVEQASALQTVNANGSESDWTQGYGYQFWRCRHNAYRGDGAFGQYCVIMPDQDAVLAITGGTDDMGKPLELLWELLPAMRSDALPEDAAAHAALKAKLASLALPPVQGEATGTAAPLVSNRTYEVEANELDVKTLSLAFDESGCTITIKRGDREETIPCGYGVWQPGQTTLYNQPWEFEPAPVLTSGAWTAPDRFTAILRLYQTPFYHTVVYHFMDDELLIESRINASFQSIKTLLLTARPI